MVVTGFDGGCVPRGFTRPPPGACRRQGPEPRRGSLSGEDGQCLAALGVYLSRVDGCDRFCGCVSWAVYSAADGEARHCCRACRGGAQCDLGGAKPGVGPQHAGSGLPSRGPTAFSPCGAAAANAPARPTARPAQAHTRATASLPCRKNPAAATHPRRGGRDPSQATKSVVSAWAAVNLPSSKAMSLNRSRTTGWRLPATASPRRSPR